MLFGTTAFAAESIPVTISANTHEDNLKNALAAGIIEKTDYNLTDAVSREQFCEFAYNMINSVKELPVAKLAQSPFDDTHNYKINALNFVGIINGKADRTFAPDDKITREEAAVILYRLAKYSGLEMPLVKPDITYSDNAEISDWAMPSVYSLKTLNIVTNKADDTFSPGMNYTIEETLISLTNLYNLIK